MEPLEEVQDRPAEFFLSRAGPDREIAEAIAHILEAAGRTVILQDWDFKNRAFMERMHTALCSGARTIALLSPDYLARDRCTAEWQNTISDDPLNKASRLIMLRIRPCLPVGLLKSLAYWDLVPVLAGSPASGGMLRDVVLEAVQLGRQKGLPPNLSKLFCKTQPVLHPEIRPTPNFAGRQEQLIAIERALVEGARAVAQPVVVHGFGGVGKSTLAREYAYRASNENMYTGIWWLNAAKAPDTGTFDGIEQGFAGLRSLLYPGTSEPQDRARAAHDTLAFLSAHGSEKPWLLIYDNVDDQGILRAWPPPANVRVLMTSRIANWRSDVTRIDVSEWTMPEAVTYLRDESGRSDLTETNAERVAAELGRLPLALSHAAAYLRDVDNATPEGYVAALSHHLKDVPDSADYPRAVSTTLVENVRQAEARALGAAAVLSLAAFYAPDDIPEELYQQDVAVYLSPLQPVVENALALEKAIGALARLSLIKFRREDRGFSTHRLVQAAAREALGAEQNAWAAAAVAAIDAALPKVEFANWHICERLVPHARAAAQYAGGEVDQSLARLLNKVGLYLVQRAAYAEAEPVYRRSLAICERALGQDHRIVGTLLNNLGGLYDAQGKNDLAEPLFQRSLEILEEALGPDHSDVSNSLNNLAELYRAQAKYDLALPLHQRALAIREEVLGPDHPDVSISLQNLAGLYREQGKDDLAEPLFQRSLAIREEALGPDHPDVGTALNNLALLYMGQGKYDLAEPLFQRSLTISERARGQDHPDFGASLQNLADLYREQGKDDLAEPLLQRSLAIREKALGPDHRLVASSLNSLALLHIGRRKYDLAEPLLERSLAIYESAFRPGHPDTAIMLLNLAYCLTGMRRRDDAERSARRGHNVAALALGADHQTTTELAKLLVFLESVRERGAD
jgi:Tfp pilus assembly protein PilF